MIFSSCSLLLITLLLFGVSSILLSSGQTLSVISSNANTKDRLTPQPPIPFVFMNVTDPTRALSAIKVFPEVQYQQILAFGGAITEAASSVWLKLPADLQKEVIQAYYNATSGIGYTWARVPLNSCDFTEKSYSFDDVVDDFDLVYFDTNATHDRQNMIPFILAARNVTSNKFNSQIISIDLLYNHLTKWSVNLFYLLEFVLSGRNNLRLFATPWSPPAWMKANNAMDGSPSPGLKADTRYHKAWANYFVKFFQTYQSFDIDFWGLTIQNEPEALPAPWESCLYTPEEEVEFLVNYLYPALNPVYPELNIMFYDHNKNHVFDWANAFYTHPTAKNMVWGMAMHWYSGDQFENLRLIKEAWPEKPMMATEACHCGGPSYNNWGRGEDYSHDIIGDIIAGASGWTDWNVLLDNTGGPNHLGNLCDAPIIARLDLSPVSLVYQPMYYHLGHFSRYLPPGSIRIAHQFDVDNTNLEFLTFLVPLAPNSTHFNHKTGKLFNNKYSDITGESGTRADAHARGTDSSDQIVIIVLNRSGVNESFSVQADNSMFANVNVPANSIHTLLFDIELLLGKEKKTKISRRVQ